MPLIKAIEVMITTNAISVATKDPVYVGVVTKHMGAREFPLRYQKTGIELLAGKSYGFGFGDVNDPVYPPAWDSVSSGSNGLIAYPLEVSPGGQFDVRVYIRKEPVRADGELDSLLVLDDVSVTLRLADDESPFFYRSRYQYNTDPSIIRLANENGQIVYLYPV